MKLSACAVLALLTATPVLADPPGDFTGSDRAPNNSGSGAGPLQGTHPDLDACEQLMERAFYMNDPASLDRAVDAHREMELARDAFHAGDRFACTRHAMHALEDRT